MEGNPMKPFVNPSLIPGIMRVSAELSAVVAAKRFRQELDEVPAGDSGGIENAAHREELSLLRAFRAEGTARIVADTLTTRG